MSTWRNKKKREKGKRKKKLQVVRLSRGVSSDLFELPFPPSPFLLLFFYFSLYTSTDHRNIIDPPKTQKSYDGRNNVARS